MEKMISESDKKTIEALEHHRLLQLEILSELDQCILKIKRKYQITERETVLNTGRY